MIGVRQTPLGEIPGLLPSEAGIVEQDAHQFGYCHCRMRVVQLDRNLVGELSPIGVIAAEPADQIGQGTSDQEIFLYEAERLPHTRRVVGVQHARQRLGCQSPGQSRNEVATAEFLEIEIIRCCRRPQAEGVYVLSAVTHHRTVEGNSDHSGWPARDRAQSAFVHGK